VNQDRFQRVRYLIGDTAFHQLAEAFVTVIGLGAVGSYAVEALARSGVGKLRLVDFDRVQPTNFNRQLYALESNLGRLKVDVAAERVTEINPFCQVEALEVFVHEDTLDQVLSGPPDLVIDAIDALNPKVQLLASVQRTGIPVVSSMGAALRTDPSQIRVGLLTETTGCPLARLIRKRLRRLNVPLELTCVYSTESLPSRSHSASVDACPSEDIVERGRTRRPLGSLSTITGMFGLCAANTALQKLIAPQP
jgi:tRNA A37 threonylcarbamoyladenosine dehydratase